MRESPDGERGVAAGGIASPSHPRQVTSQDTTQDALEETVTEEAVVAVSSAVPIRKPDFHNLKMRSRRFTTF